MRRITRTLAVMCALLAFLSSARDAAAQLQTGTIRGRVIDETDQAVPGVTVTLKDAQRGTQRVAASDATGAFQFLAVAVGNDFELTAELSGFQNAVVSHIVVNPGFTQNFDLRLKVGGVSETVSVVAEKPLIDTKTTQESTSIDSQFLTALPLASGNFTEIVPQLPGVSWNRGGRLTFYQFNIHGADIWGNAYRVDGATTMFSSNRAGFLVVPSAIERMEVLADGIPAEYGEQYGGVIKITTKSGTNAPTLFVKSIFRPNGLYSSQQTGIPTQVLDKPPGSSNFQEISFGGPIHRDHLWNFFAFQMISEQQGSVLTRDEPVKLDFPSFSDKITWQQRTNDRWDFGFFASPEWAYHRPSDNTVSAGSKFAQRTPGMDFFHLLQTHIFNDRTFVENSFSLYHLELYTDSDLGHLTVDPNAIYLRSWNPALGVLYQTGPYPNYSRTFNLRGRYSIRLFKNTVSHTMKTGLDYTEQFGTSFSSQFIKNVSDLSGRPGGGPVTTSSTFWDNPSVRDRQLGYYAQDSWAVGSRATLEYGLRYDRESVVGRNNFAPRAGLSIDPGGDGKQKVFANWGVIYSNLNSQFYTFVSPGQQGVATYTIVNPDANYNGTLVLRSRTFHAQDEIKNPYVTSASVGIERRMPLDAKVSITYNHRNYSDNFKGTSVSLNKTDVLQTYRNDGTGKYDGVEFVVRKYFSRQFDLLAHYTLAKSVGTSTNILSPLQQQFQYGPQDWDQRHTVFFSGNIELPYDLRITPLFRYASGRPYSITNDLPTVEAAWIDPQGHPVNRNNERMPTNATVDLTLQRAFRMTRGTLSPTFEILNLTNHVNIIGVSTSSSTPGRPTLVDTSRVMQVGFEWRF
jgi:Carboxypeptidase regulatory-like domain/TonB dependent receptor/TonB-dependent Receptor Plug Domain